MFKVTFSNSKNVLPHVVSAVNDLETAVSLALALHRSSNVPHVVYVRNEDACDILTFERVDATRDSAKNAK